jgi:hypothetical protein
VRNTNSGGGTNIMLSKIIELFNTNKGRNNQNYQILVHFFRDIAFSAG